jgi:CRISPR-associated protein Cas1
LNLLHLSGYGVKITLRNLRSRSELEVTDGKEWPRTYDKPRFTLKFRPRRIPYTSIIVDGHSGYVTLQALHWLSRSKVPVFVLDEIDGSVVSSILPPTPIKADLRAAQMRAAFDAKRKLNIANQIVQAKIARSLQVLDWLSQRYHIQDQVVLARQEAMTLDQISSVEELRAVEGRVALRYWQAFASAMPDWLEFQGRATSSRASNASDPVNAALNYGYGVLEGECRKAINAVGLEPSVGFLHEFADYQTKQSLVYDLQEPFRWIADVTAAHAFETNALDLKDFYFTGDDYRYRLETDARRRFLDLLREHFNNGVRYNGRVLKWDTVIEQKALELGRYLLGRSPRLDFLEPSPKLARSDDKTLRERIIALSKSEAERSGIKRSTYYHLRRKIRSGRPFHIYNKTRKKLKEIN